MVKRRSRIRLAGILIVVALISTYSIWRYSVEGQARTAGSGQSTLSRADIVEIDSMKVFGKLERPAVVFLHDLHTDALDKTGKDCAACHPSKNGQLTLAFKGIKNTGKDEVTDLYHSNCLSCHKEMSAAGQKTGPVEECGRCHTGKPVYMALGEPFGFDKSLHYRHSKAQEDKCELCHHVYDKKTRQLFYAKGEEATCRYCHKDQAEENRISMQQASHLACLDCHRKTLAKNIEAGPVRCEGCHDPLKQGMIKKVSLVPRIPRNQPDAVYIEKSRAEPYSDLDSYVKPKMARVPFDHKQHEDSSDTCRTCHHEDMASCNNCHTLAGSQQGGNIKLEQAMHQIDSDKSCLGCHQQEQKDGKCSGCHAFSAIDRRPKESGCLTCHSGPLPEIALQVRTLDQDTYSAIMPESRQALTGNFTDDDIPEKVVIKALTDKYGSVEFPHRKIVQALEKNIKDSKLASYFHGRLETICQGCHHNSPAIKKPPSCGNCHGKPFDEKDPHKPGLTAAYHRQCLGCHSEMGIEKPQSTDCEGCHKERTG